ncbi:MAG: SOS response-associated peptidase [Nitrospirae bacterium]|nr:MAG: SOS response-associated peptidase [Nitrospirota bacterium]
MCGRFSQTSSPEVVAEQFGFVGVPLFLTPRYNIAPSQPVAVVRTHHESGMRECVLLRWGLIPSWAKDQAIGYKMINARAETASEKPAFRGPFRSRRCLILADGFYEWQREGRRKQPFYIRLKDRRPFAFAGLWDKWEPQGGEAVESCTILTTGPNDVLKPIHERMPVIVAPQAYSLWLDPTVQQVEAIRPILQPYSADRMEVYPVSLLVNNSRHNAPTCLEPA